MEKMVYMKLKGMKLLNQAQSEITRLGGLLENKYGDD